MAQVDSQFPPPPRATVKDFVDHIDYAVKLIGVDHVGISSDFDGGGGVDGWNQASETFNVTLELVRRGYTEEQIAKMWSGNLLRVMRQVEKVAAGLQKKAQHAVRYCTMTHPYMSFVDSEITFQDRHGARTTAWPSRAARQVGRASPHRPNARQSGSRSAARSRSTRAAPTSPAGPSR